MVRINKECSKTTLMSLLGNCDWRLSLRCCAFCILDEYHGNLFSVFSAVVLLNETDRQAAACPDRSLLYFDPAIAHKRLTLMVCGLTSAMSPAMHISSRSEGRQGRATSEITSMSSRLYTCKNVNAHSRSSLAVEQMLSTASKTGRIYALLEQALLRALFL